MPYEIADAPGSDQHLGMALGGAIGLAAMSPIGGRLLMGGLKYGLKGAWGATKMAARTGAAVAGAGWAARGPIAGMVGAYGGAAARVGFGAARTALGGTAYAGMKAASWLYRNPGVALAGVAPLALAKAAFDNERAPGRGVIGSPNMTDVMGGTGGQAGISALMDTINATGDVVLGMHKRR